MITAAGSEPGPGGVGPGTVIRTGCADRGGGGQSQYCMGLGNGGSGTRSGLAVSLAEQPVRLGGKFFGTPVMLRSSHCCFTRLAVLAVLALDAIPRTLPVNSLPWHARNGDRARHRLRLGQHCRITVAHHSCAIIEAGERGHADVLKLEFEPAPDALSSAPRR
jgi:hypothetical protein